MALSIGEWSTKKLLTVLPSLSEYVGEMYTIESMEDIEAFRGSGEKSGGLWVVKPDVLLKRRGKSGLVFVGKNVSETVSILREHLNREIELEGVSGVLSKFIVERFFAHESGKNEMYVSMQTGRLGDEVIFLRRGGMILGNTHELDESAVRLSIPLYLTPDSCSGSVDLLNENNNNNNNNNNTNTNTNIYEEKLKNLDIKSILSKITYNEDMLSQEEKKDAKLQEILKKYDNNTLTNYLRESTEKFLNDLYRGFVKFHFSFLELNPFSFDFSTLKTEKKISVKILDACAKLDHTADFICNSYWNKGGISFPAPFGRRLSAEEEYVRDLDAKTGASLKLTILNKHGRFWTLVAGGGASVIYADTICDLGKGHELANYGEYSGAPSLTTTYEYSKTVIKLLLESCHFHYDHSSLSTSSSHNVLDKNVLESSSTEKNVPENENIEMGAVLLIGGGIANFTSVAETFSGILKSLKEYAFQLNKYNVRIYVRRGGPQYEDGLKLMRDFGREYDIFVQVYGPDTYITDIVPISIEHDKYLSENTFESLKKRVENGEENRKKWTETQMSIIEEDSNFQDLIKSLTISRTQVSPQSDTSTLASRQTSPGNSSLKFLDIDSQAFVYGLQIRAVQEMLDFDHVCKRRKPSVCGIIYEFSVSHMRPFYFGTEEIFIPVYQTITEAIKDHPNCKTMINFASMRSAALVSKVALEQYKNQFNLLAIIAEGVPERYSREIGLLAKENNCTLIGPATVGGIVPGSFRIGNTGGSLENIMNSKLYRKGSIGFITKSGGMLNEMNNMLGNITKHADGCFQGIAIGGDRFPGTSFVEHMLRYENDENCKMIIVLGEMGGTLEYDVAEHVRNRSCKKPVVAWCIGTCAQRFSTEVSFGHAGAWAGSQAEHSDAKNMALKDAGCFVPNSFSELGAMIGSVYSALVQRKVIIPRVEAEAPRLPMDYAWAKKLGLVRKPKGFVSTISDDRGEELLYAGWPITKVLDPMHNMGIGGVLALLWFKRPLPDYCYRYLETVLMLTADHGPAVCGAHNTIVTARAGKDLISSLISGLCCIGDRFGGACDQAAQQFLNAGVFEKLTPREFVVTQKKNNQLIMGIGHRIKSVHNPDTRVQLLKTFCKKNFPAFPLIQYAEQVEKITTKKKDTLILNVDGLIGVSMCDMLFHCGNFTQNEAKDYIECGCINGLFVLGRSIGFIGHFIDQKRLKQGLYRHDADDIAYVLPGFS